ncbi:MAG: molybdopterin-dependent oxidoreductase, partial [Pseudomonadota bacterium]
LGRQRLDKPYLRDADGKLKPVSWQDALGAVAERLKGDASKIAAIAGDLACAEGMKATLDLMRSLGVQSTDCRQDGAKIGIASDGSAMPRESYLFNSTLMGVEDADALLLIGVNPRVEAAVFNARIRKSWIHNELKIGLIGPQVDLTYDVEYLGAGPESLLALKPGDKFYDVLKSAERPMIIVGQGALARGDGAAVLSAVSQLAADVGAHGEGWNGFNVLHNAASRVGGLDMGFLPGEGGRDIAGALTGAQAGEVETLFLLGADEIDAQHFGDAFVVYIGSHGDRGAHSADVILPSAAYTEKSATYVNTEGRVQRTQRAVAPKGEAREDWAILRALSDYVGKTLPYDSLDELRAKLGEDHPSFLGLDYAPGADSAGDAPPYGAAGQMGAAPFEAAVTQFHLTNPIARASKVMAECAELAASDAPAAAAE